MSLFDWSTSAALNGSVDPTLPVSDGASARVYMSVIRTLMAQVAAYSSDQAGVAVISGPDNEYVGETASGIATLRDGISLTVPTPPSRR
jgi:hypothetical protein